LTKRYGEHTAVDGITFSLERGTVRRYRELDDPIRRIGAVLESGDFDPGRSGRNRLRALALAGGVSPSRVDEVLQLVELDKAADRRVSTYSLGSPRSALCCSSPTPQSWPRPAGSSPAGGTFARSEMHAHLVLGIAVVTGLAVAGLRYLVRSRRRDDGDGDAAWPGLPRSAEH
jgi:hypothetical protein